MRKLIFVLLLALTLSAGFAQMPFEARFLLDEFGDYLQDFAYNGDSFVGINISPLQRVGVSPVSSPGNFRASNWPHVNDANGGNLDVNKYIGFTITADPDYKFTVTSIEFCIGRSGTGTRQTEWKGSADGYQASFTDYYAGSGLENIGGVLHNIDESHWGWPEVTEASFRSTLNPGTAYEDITTSCGFRMYMHHAEHPGGTAGFVSRPHSQPVVIIRGSIQYTGSGSVFDISEETLSGLDYEHGDGPSNMGSFQVCGGTTTGDVTVSLPSNSSYEFYDQATSTYVSSLTLDLRNMGGFYVTTPVRVRLKAFLAIGNYNETITVTRTGFANKTISCSGSVTQPPPPPPTTPTPPPPGYFADF